MRVIVGDMRANELQSFAHVRSQIAILSAIQPQATPTAARGTPAFQSSSCAMSDHRRRHRSCSMRPPSGGCGNDLESLKRKLARLAKKLRDEQDDRSHYKRRCTKLENELSEAKGNPESDAEELRELKERLKLKDTLVVANNVDIRHMESQLKTFQTDLEQTRQSNDDLKKEKQKLEQKYQAAFASVKEGIRLLVKGFDNDPLDPGVNDKDALLVPGGSHAHSGGGNSDTDSLPEPASAPAALGPAPPVDAAHAAAAVVPSILPGNAAPAPVDPVVRMASETS